MGKAPDPMRDPLRGAWVGMAIGDAIGAVHAGASVARPDDAWRDLPAGGPQRLPVGVFGSWTSLALATAEALVTGGEVEVAQVRSAVARWWREGRWGPLGHALPVAPATRAWLGAWGVAPPDGVVARGASGDALALVVPIALYLRHHPAAAEAAVAAMLATAGPQVVATAGDLTRSIVAVARGAGAAAAAPKASDPLVAAALAIAHGASSYEESLRTVAADPHADAALGALVGLLVGARGGLRAIPARWRAQVAWGLELVAIADRLGDGPAAGPAKIDYPWRTWSRAPAPARER